MAKGKKTGGRVAGTPNKLNADVKQAILDAFESVGSARYLEGVANDNPAVFCALLGKILPKEVVAEITTKTHEEALLELK